MIGPTNPLQVSFLEKINIEIGNLTTSLIATQIERELFRSNLEDQVKKNEALKKTVEEMAQTNANLREQVLQHLKVKRK
jgi:cell division protein FtsB